MDNLYGYISCPRTFWSTSCSRNGFRIFYLEAKSIQNDLTKDIHQKFNRLEGIIIKLIDQQKKMQIELRGIKSQYDALVKIITDLIKGKDNGKD